MPDFRMPFRPIFGEEPSWEWTCPETGELVGPHMVPQHCAVSWHPHGFMGWGLWPNDKPQFLGLHTSWEAVLRACERHRRSLPVVMRAILAGERREQWWSATEPKA